MDVFRLSRRHISRILNTSEKKSETHGTLFDNVATFLSQVEKFDKKLPQGDTTPEIQKIRRDLKKLIKNLQMLAETTQLSQIDQE